MITLNQILRICVIATSIFFTINVHGQWLTTGNPLVGPGILGSTSNWDILFQTDGINRMRLRETSTTNINGSIINTSGFLGLHTTQPWSMFHIQGPNNTSWYGNGYREWMHTGTYCMENSDNLFVGMKDEAFNRSDAVWAWGDDTTDTRANYTRFIFTNSADAAGDCEDCPTNPQGLYGREVLRLAPNGFIGVGPFFEETDIKSNIHVHMEDTMSVWFQQTNEEGTGSAATDGLRMGINGSENQQVNGNALIYNQENRHLLLSTGQNTDATDIGNGNTLERVRITSIGAPTNTPTGGYGIYNPAFLPGIYTRVAISHNPGTAVTRPLSLLHLGYNVGTAGAPTSTHGWRHWMDIGMFATNGTDNIYVGLKEEDDDKFDAVINWGDDQDTLAQDNLRFVFTSTAGGTGDATSQSINGKEVGRFAPTGEFGIGNFYTNGLNEQPTEKLDVDGTSRFRLMERDTTAEVIITGVKADTITGDYVLHYEFADSLGLGCEWNEVTNGLNDDLVMGYMGACNQGRVGIGVSNPFNSKLQVFQETPSGSTNFGTSSFAFGAAASVSGVYGYAQTVDDGDSNMHRIIGTAGIARSSHCLHEVIGVYGAAGADESCSGSWAGYFNGNVHATGSITWNSDESLKQNIEDIEGGLEIINQLQPRTYEFIPDVHEGLNLATGLQYGLVAQELEEVVPAIVKDVNHLAQYDSDGNLTAPPVSLKAVNYNALIPILIAGMKEQQTIIESQNEALAQVMDQMENLQQQINNCCSADGALPKNFGSGNDASETGSVFGENELHQNTPNPFRSQTTISYVLEQGGKVLLNIFDKTGKPITTLVEAEQAAGTYRYEWDASGLPAGLYHYALYVDGDLLVKKAIKLAD